ncbi:helix-turn-helix transcriptional regulator [Klebsiella aerogenes]|uniref:helix-turn-helix transcriptional regulator n=1 Tax=Klebsiella aerogenes TaxID=548 RepID=UPI00351D6D24
MTSAEVGERVGYTRWHLQRLFKQATGNTLVGYIRGRRITVAGELLKTTSLSIADIYVQVGYDCGATFSHAFKQYFGISASEFRDSKDDFTAKMIHPLR